MFWKRVLNLSCALVFFAFLPKSQAQLNEWVPISPPASNIFAIAYAPSSPSIVYMSTSDRGVFKSTDGGNTWASANANLPSSVQGYGDTAVVAFAVHPSDANTVYASMPGAGVFKSTNGGGTWTAINNGLPESGVNGFPDLGNPFLPWAIAIDPNNPQTLYVGSSGLTADLGNITLTPSGGIYKSVNGGDSWSASSTGLPTDNPFLIYISLVVDPSNSDNVYVGTRSMNAGLGIYKSADAGANWSAINTGIPNVVDGADTYYVNINQLAISPSNPSILYAAAGVEFNFANLDGGIYKTTDGGQNWAAVNTGLPTFEEEIDGTPITFHYSIAVAVDPTNPDIVYTGGFSSDISTPSGFYKTVNGGDSWNTVGNSMVNFIPGFLAVNPSNTSDILAGTTACGMFKTSNAGGLWTMNNTGITNSSSGFTALFVAVGSLVTDSHNTSNLYAVTGACGILESNNLGDTWDTLNKGLVSTDITAFAIDSQGLGIRYAGSATNGMYKYTDLAQSWFSINNGLTDTGIVDIAVDPSNPSTAYALTTSGPFVTNNGGLLWSAANSGLPSASGTFFSFSGISSTLVIDPSTPSTLYVTTTADGVFKSIDSGASWSAVNNGLADLSTLALAIDPSNPNTLYVTNALGIYKTTNGGENWSAAASGLPSGALVVDLRVVPQDSSTLYATVFENGVYLSSDGGGSWAAFNTGLSNLNTLAISSDGTGDNIFASALNLPTGSLSPSLRQGIRLHSTAGSGEGIYKYQYASGTIAGAGGTGSGAVCNNNCSLNLANAESLWPFGLCLANLAWLSLTRIRRREN